MTQASTPPTAAPPLREHIGIAIDGGGVKGAIVAQGLIELEQQLGVERLIDAPQVKVVTGTSTGAVLAAGIAAGLSGADLLALYRELAASVFRKAERVRPFGTTIPLLSRLRPPMGLVRALDRLPLGLGSFLLYALLSARYSFEPLRDQMQHTLRTTAWADDPSVGTDPTLGAVGNYLRRVHHGPTLIITAAEVSARRTHFLKTTLQERYQHMKLLDAVLASSSIPTYFPPIELPGGKPRDRRWLVDGGVGNFGNPALIAAWELCDRRNPDPLRQYDPAATSVVSFGTGVLSRDTYRRVHGDPRAWWALEWAPRALEMFGDSAIRQQSRSILAAYPGIDLRRFQVELDRAIGADRFDLLDSVIRERGEAMRRLVRENRHALNPDPALRHDPEGIWDETVQRVE